MDILKETDQIIEILWQRIKYLYGDKSVGPMVRLQYNDVHFHGPTDWEGDQDSVSTRMPILRRWLRLQIAKNLKKYGHVFIYTCRDDSNLSFETPPDDLDLSLMNQDYDDFDNDDDADFYTMLEDTENDYLYISYDD